MPLKCGHLDILNGPYRFAIILLFSTLAVFLLPARTLAAEPVMVGTKDGPYKMYDESRALIIGVSQYQNKLSWPKLALVPTEVEAVRAALSEKGFETEVILNPSSIDLYSKIKTFLLQRMARDTRLLIYYVGHGWTNRKFTGYLVPVDAPADDSDEFISKLVNMAEIKQLSYKSQAKHILFVFDSCFSGAIFLTRSNFKPSDVFFLKDIDRPGRQFLTSGDASEQVPDQMDFADAFIAGIKGDADYNKDGIVSATELGFWLKNQIIPLRKQTPQFGSAPEVEYRGGDLVFVTGASTERIVLENVQVKPPAGTGPRQAALRGLGQPSLPGGQGFEGVEVFYYKKLSDGDRITKALNAKGIPFVVTRAELPDKFEVNSIACGPDVPLEALKTLAITLINGGVPIQNIIQFRNPALKPHRLELLSLTEDRGVKGSVSTPVLSVAQINQLTQCPISLRGLP